MKPDRPTFAEGALYGPTLTQVSYGQAVERGEMRERGLYGSAGRAEPEPKRVRSSYGLPEFILQPIPRGTCGGCLHLGYHEGEWRCDRRVRVARTGPVALDARACYGYLRRPWRAGLGACAECGAPCLATRIDWDEAWRAHCSCERSGLYTLARDVAEIPADGTQEGGRGSE